MPEDSTLTPSQALEIIAEQREAVATAETLKEAVEFVRRAAGKEFAAGNDAAAHALRAAAGRLEATIKHEPPYSDRGISRALAALGVEL